MKIYGYNICISKNNALIYFFSEWERGEYNTLSLRDTPLEEGNLMPRLCETPLYRRGIKYPVSARHPFIKGEFNALYLRDSTL
jgi:hypothetical protein